MPGNENGEINISCGAIIDEMAQIHERAGLGPVPIGRLEPSDGPRVSMRGRLKL